MKVQNTSIFVGDASRSQRHGRAQQQECGKKNVFAGGMNHRGRYQGKLEKDRFGYGGAQE